MQRYPQVKITVHEIKNEYFGGNVSVAGLITGTDIIKQCGGNLHSDLLGVPEVMIRDEGPVSRRYHTGRTGQGAGLPGHQYPHRRRRVL